MSVFCGNVAICYTLIVPEILLAVCGWYFTFDACTSCQVLTYTVVTQAAMGGPRRAERFTSEAVLELYHLLVDEDLLGSWRRAI